MMLLPNSGNHCARRRRSAAILSAAALLTMGAALPVHSAGGDGAADLPKTATPIKHVIVVIGENRGFDHIYATYVPKILPGPAKWQPRADNGFAVWARVF